MANLIPLPTAIRLPANFAAAASLTQPGTHTLVVDTRRCEVAVLFDDRDLDKVLRLMPGAASQRAQYSQGCVDAMSAQFEPVRIITWSEQDLTFPGAFRTSVSHDLQQLIGESAGYQRFRYSREPRFTVQALPSVLHCRVSPKDRTAALMVSPTGTSTPLRVCFPPSKDGQLVQAYFALHQAVYHGAAPVWNEKDQRELTRRQMQDRLRRLDAKLSAAHFRSAATMSSCSPNNLVMAVGVSRPAADKVPAVPGWSAVINRKLLQP